MSTPSSLIEEKTERAEPRIRSFFHLRQLTEVVVARACLTSTSPCGERIRSRIMLACSMIQPLSTWISAKDSLNITSRDVNASYVSDNMISRLYSLASNPFTRNARALSPPRSTQFLVACFTFSAQQKENPTTRIPTRWVPTELRPPSRSSNLSGQKKNRHGHVFMSRVAPGVTGIEIGTVPSIKRHPVPDSHCVAQDLGHESVFAVWAIAHLESWSQQKEPDRKADEVQFA